MALSILVGSGLVGDGKRGGELRVANDGTELVDLIFTMHRGSCLASRTPIRESTTIGAPHWVYWTVFLHPETSRLNFF